MTDIRAALAAGDRAFDHFEEDACDLDEVCGGLVAFLTANFGAGTAVLADGDYGDITVSSSGTVFNIDANVVTATELASDAVTTAKILNSNVTLAKLVDIATASFLGRTSASTGVVEVLTATQATAMLNAATTTLKGLVPAPPNNTTTFLRGDASFATPPAATATVTGYVPTPPNNASLFLRGDATWSGPPIPYHFGGAVMTAGDQNRFANPVGFSTSPIGTTGYRYVAGSPMELVAITYVCTAAHTTNTVTITPRIAGVEQTTHTLTINANDTFEHLAFTGSPAPYALAAGDTFACQMDHNGATNLANLMVTFWFRPT